MNLIIIKKKVTSKNHVLSPNLKTFVVFTITPSGFASESQNYLPAEKLSLHKLRNMINARF